MNTSDYIKKPKGYWDNYDNCKNECNKYCNLKELKANSSGCYYALIRNKWKDEFFPYRIKIESKWKIKENCIAKAKRYNNYATFVRSAYDCYLSMRENGWLDEVFNHCPDYKGLKYWNNYEHCKEECKKYNTIKELRRNNNECYNSVMRNDWKNDFFIIKHKDVKDYGYWNNIENCINECKRYSNITEVKNKSNGCYASILRHGWENTCFPLFKKRRPNGFWDIKENCITEAVKYRNLREFQINSYGAYYSCKINGWIDEINNMYDKTILYHLYDEIIHSVYAYEFPLFNSCYIGRTNCLKRRHQQHLKDKNDTVYKFCKEKNIKFPTYKVLKENLKAQDSQYYEDYYVRKFKDDGWIILNKAVTGVNKGSLGAICKWNYNECKKEASKYASIAEFKKHNQSAYNACNKNGWTYDFFSQKKLSNHYWDNYDNCKEAFLKCKNAKELIKRFGGCYNAIKKNGFTDLKYPK